ncbi:hypothetical protein [Dyella sp. S184]|uniref:hypothetical protein n=1 Tax=Dyella sp. S184 TaxID=1641862 RepID=UPI00131DA2AE|nr:hypothetical protein [Dyella sp. S184]
MRKLVAVSLAMMLAVGAASAENQPNGNSKKDSGQDRQQASQSAVLAIKEHTAPTQSSSDSAEAQSETDKKITKYTGKLASYTLALDILTGFLVLGGIAQGVLIGRQIKLSREEFAASHRPKIRIRRIDNMVFAIDQPITATIQVSNVGETNAKIFSVGIDIFFRYPPGGAEEFDATPNTLIQVVPPGMGASIDVKCRNLKNIEVEQFKAGIYELCALGHIAYEDGAGIKRNTSFFRIYDRTSSRFVAAPNDPRQGDREYED